MGTAEPHAIVPTRSLACPRIVRHLIPTMVLLCGCHNRASSLVRMYAEPWRTQLHRLAHRGHTAGAHVGIFLGGVSPAVVPLPSWLLRAAFMGVPVVHAVVVWRGFGVPVKESER